MGKNKLKKFADMASYRHVFEADFADLMTEGVPHPHHMKGQWHSWFGNNNPIVVELGCGRGEYAVGLARAFPNVNYIGVDIKGARMHAGATQAVNEGLTNVAFIRTRIEFIECFFDQNEVDQIWVTFPDPQMNKVRKRLVGTLMLQRYRSFLNPTGALHLKTDSPFLFAYTTAMLEANNITPQACTDNLYEAQPAPLDSVAMSIRTYYEQKWIDAGLSIKYIRFSIPATQTLVEPNVEIEHDNYHNVGRSVRIIERN